MEWISGLSAQAITLGFLSLFASAILGVIFQESIYLLVARTMNWLGIKNKRGINGLWEGIYLYPSGENNLTERHVLQLRQIGKYVLGTDIEAEAHKNIIFGQFEDNKHFTGTWKNLKAGHDYKGAVQLVLDNHGEELNGQWIGFDGHNSVKNGPWLLKLLDRKTSKQAQQAALARKNYLLLPPEWENMKTVFEGLIATYKEAWENKDSKKILEVFCPDATYYERVGEEPFRGHSGIEKYWEEKVLATQNNISFNLKNLYIIGSVGVAEWEAYFDRLDTKERIHLFEIAIMKLKNNKIYEFKEYWRSKKVKDL